VEDQATDRAHRLGQRRTVHVHKLVCGGTVEEGIDALIRGKRELAQRVMTTGEQALSRLSTEELRELIRLRDPEERA
jgi:SNF2 family DNA or RNA helicase